MEKVTGVILGLVSAFIGSMLIFGNASFSSWNIALGILLWGLGILIIWLGFNVRKLEKSTQQKTLSKINQIPGFSKECAIVNDLKIKVFHHISLSLLHPYNYLSIGIELNHFFTDSEKQRLKKEFTNESIDHSEYLVFRYTPFFVLNENHFQKKLNRITENVLSFKQSISDSKE